MQASLSVSQRQEQIMLRTLLLTAQAAVTRPVEMLAFPARLWFSSRLHYSVNLFPATNLHGAKEGGEEARKSSCNLLQTDQLSPGQ
jgi:hypothetical protein